MLRGVYKNRASLDAETTERSKFTYVIHTVYLLILFILLQVQIFVQS
jgi:hypothetical protein